MKELRIKATANPGDSGVYVDGDPIACYAADVQIRAGEPPMARLGVYIDELDLENPEVVFVAETPQSNWFRNGVLIPIAFAILVVVIFG